MAWQKWQWFVTTLQKLPQQQAQEPEREQEQEEEMKEKEEVEETRTQVVVSGPFFKKLLHNHFITKKFKKKCGEAKDSVFSPPFFLLHK